MVNLKKVFTILLVSASFGSAGSAILTHSEVTAHADDSKSMPMIYDPQKKLNKQTVAHVKDINNLMERRMNGQPELQIAVVKHGSKNVKKSKAAANTYFNRHANHQFGWKNGMILYMTTHPRTYQLVIGSDLQYNLDHSKKSTLITGDMAQYLAKGDFNKFVMVTSNSIYNQLSSKQIVKATHPKDMIHETPKIEKRNWILTYSFAALMVVVFVGLLWLATRWYLRNRDRDDD